MEFNFNTDKLFEGIQSPLFTDDEIRKPQATMIQDIFEASVFLNKMTDEDQSIYVAILMSIIRVMKHKCSKVVDDYQQPTEQHNKPQKFFE